MTIRYNAELNEFEMSSLDDVEEVLTYMSDCRAQGFTKEESDELARVKWSS